MVKQLASLALAICLLVGLCCPASAAVVVPDGTFSSDYFASYGCFINDNGGHVLHITFTTTGMGVCDEIGVANYCVQKQYTLEDGSTIWADITGLLPGITRTNTSFCTYGVNFQGVAGERYRVRATFICSKQINGVYGTETKSVCTTGCTVN
jgi:hypothetical protein